MPTNYLTTFANGGSANLPNESTWQGLTERSTGFQTGLAKSSYFNRLFAQGAVGSYVIGRMVVNYANEDADLSGNDLYTNYLTALRTYIGNYYMPLAGGAVTNGNWAYRTIDSGYLRISGGSSASLGGNVVFRGEAASNNAGGVELMANDGVNSIAIKINANGDVEYNTSAHHVAFGKGTYTLTNYCAPGYLTTNSTILRFTLPILTRGTVSFSDITASVRVGTGGFTTPGGSTAESIIPVGVSVSVSALDNALSVTLTKSAGWNATNNSTVTVFISTMTFTIS